MNYRKQGLKVLGVSLLAALGLMAFGASGASAAGTFLILKGDGGLLPTFWETTFSGEGENLLTGRFWILGLNIEISCHAATASGTVNSAGNVHGEILFSNCLASGTNADGTLKGAICKLTNHITAKFLGEVILHTGNVPYLLLLGLDHLTLATVNGAPCLPNAAVKGSQVLSISNPGGHDVVKLLSSKGLAALFPSDKLTYGINAAHLEADAEVQLSSIEHKNLAWGAT